MNYITSYIYQVILINLSKVKIVSSNGILEVWSKFFSPFYRNNVHSFHQGHIDRYYNCTLIYPKLFLTTCRPTF